MPSESWALYRSYSFLRVVFLSWSPTSRPSTLSNPSCRTATPLRLKIFWIATISSRFYQAKGPTVSNCFLAEVAPCHINLLVFSGLLSQAYWLSSRSSSWFVRFFYDLLFMDLKITCSTVSECSWPMSFFDRFFPVLGSNFGLGALGIFQCL